MQQVELEQAVDISEAIISALEQVDLESVAQLYGKRQTLIERYYQQEQTVDSALTARLKQLNDQILARLEELKLNTRSQQLELNHSSKASRTYLDIAAE